MSRWWPPARLLHAWCRASHLWKVGGACLSLLPSLPLLPHAMHLAQLLPLPAAVPAMPRSCLCLPCTGHACAWDHGSCLLLPSHALTSLALPSAGDYTIPESQSYDPVIAAVPLMALVGLAGFLSVYLIRWGLAAVAQTMPSARDVCNTLGHPCVLAQHSFSLSTPPTQHMLPSHHPTASRRHRLLFASGRRGAAAAAAVLATADGAPAPRRRPSDPVHLLTFDDLSCAVPLRRRFQWLRRLFTCGRSSAAPAAQNAGVTAAVAVGGGVADVPGYKQIVKGASGVAANGELVGVLGPSGAALKGRGATRLSCVRLLKLVARRSPLQAWLMCVASLRSLAPSKAATRTQLQAPAAATLPATAACTAADPTRCIVLPILLLQAPARPRCWPLWRALLRTWTNDPCSPAVC